MRRTVYFLLFLTASVAYIQAASNPKALALVKLVADVLYKSPANNDFIFMVEHKMMDNGIANLIEGMATKFASSNACAQFQASRPGSLTVGPVHKRALENNDVLQKDVLNILNSAEGKAIIDQEVSGTNKVPAPRYSSGGFNFGGKGKRDQTDDMQKEVISILDGAEGQHVMDDKVAGKDMNIPAPRYNSGGVSLGRKKRSSTSQHNIAAGQHAGYATKATALMARVRNIVVNKASLRLFLTALNDGTVRAAMYNVCRCNAIASTIRYIYNTGV